LRQNTIDRETPVCYTERKPVTRPIVALRGKEEQEQTMRLKQLFGLDDKKPEEEGEGPIVIRVEFDGKTFTRRYPDLDTAQLRFPQYLSELAALHRNTLD